MPRIHQHLHYADTRAELVEHKDAARGAMEDAFWDENELVDHRPQRSKKKAPKKKRGCPENDYKEHVYVVERLVHHWRWGGKCHSYEFDATLCCGCGKRK